MKNIGVFICHCGVNIAGTVDVCAVAKKMAEVDGVAYSTDYIYMCSEPGQQLIREAAVEKGLDGLVVACCSPSMHENTFRKAARNSGINPYLCEIANIREQCAWVHQKNRQEATGKAGEIILSAIEKLKGNQALQPTAMRINRRACVIGAGIAGMTAALDLADGGYEVALVEREHFLGGKVTQLSRMYPDLDPARQSIDAIAARVQEHPRINVYYHAEVEQVKGYVGNFDLTIRKKSTLVDWDKCTGCGECLEVCPVKFPSEFDRGLSMKKAIDAGPRGGIPGKPVIQKSSCLHFGDGNCSECRDRCRESAIRFDLQDEKIEEKAGAIVVATGYDLYPQDKLGEYGSGTIPDVIDSLKLERMLEPDGPTNGKILRPSDGATPKEIVFIQCVASRDPERHMPYCSRICCMYTAKQAKLYKQIVPDGQPYVFYMDTRSDGKGYEEFLQQTIEEEKIVYLRGRVSRVYRDDGKVFVSGVDTLAGKKVEIAADLVVLATAMVPSPGIKDLAGILRATVDKHGFMSEAHIKLYPVESSTRGIYLAGCCQGPKDIPDSVSQASATAGKIQALLSAETLMQDPLVACVDSDICSGCAICVEMCPYEAREMNESKRISTVNQALCQGCGACIAACPNKSCQLRNTSVEQVLGMVDAFIPGGAG